MNGQLSEWGGRPYPACTGDTMATSGDSGDDVFIYDSDDYESDLTLAPIRDESYKMSISFICSDQDTNEPTDWACVFKKK
jgi:hypothetical protein